MRASGLQPLHKYSYLGIWKSAMRLLVFFILLLAAQGSSATHLMGGEIRWECLPGGQYRFSLTIFRDCNGIDAPWNAVLRVHNHPTVSSIPLAFDSYTEISPDCHITGPSLRCLDVDSASGEIPGVAEEYIYRSEPITLPGVPPAQGWVFTFDGGWRNTAIANLYDPAPRGITMRAIMYPHSAQVSGECFDSSPIFLEKPAVILCAGDTFFYNHHASDSQLDSLSYSWAEPLDGFKGGDFSFPPDAIPFVPGYSYQSPYPGTVHDPRNMPSTLNTNSGEIIFLSHNSGYFVSVVKAESWKCGEKVAEIFREMQLVIIPCGENDAPVVPAPFADAGGNYTLFSDTVDVGDTVRFVIRAIDGDTISSSVNQSVIIDASGLQFGTGFTSQDSGCMNPPCATLTPPAPLSAELQASTEFFWATTCENVFNNSGCYRENFTYTFLFRIQDDFCPVPATRYATVSITLRAKPLLPAPQLHCLAVESNGDVRLTWENPANERDSYSKTLIYSSSNRTGPYTEVAAITDHNQTSFLDTTANANAGPVYYFMRTNSGCGARFYSSPSDTLSTMFLNVSVPGNGTVNLQWNPLAQPNPASASNVYNVYRETDGTWVALGNVRSFSYADTIKRCNDTLRYRIEMFDSLGCYSVSSLDTVITTDNDYHVDAGRDTALCAGASVLLGGVPTAPSGSSISWAPSHGLNNDSIASPLALPAASAIYVVTASTSTCLNTDTVFIRVDPLPVASAGNDTAACAGSAIQLHASGGVRYEWSPAAGLDTPTSQSPLATPSQSNLYTVTVFDSLGCSSSDSIELTVHPLPVVNASADTALCAGDTVRLSSGGGTEYLWAPLQWLDDPSHASPLATPASSVTYTVTVTDHNKCVSRDSVSITVYELPAAFAGDDVSICTGDTIQLSASGGMAFQWTPFIGISSDTIAAPLAFPSVTTTYMLEVTDTNGCTSEDDITVFAIESPAAGFDALFQLTCDGVEAQFINTSLSAINYTWLLGDGTTSALENPAHTYSYLGTYNIVLIAENGGCSDTVSLAKSIGDLASHARLDPPNVFTPNGDGVNDLFKIPMEPELAGCARIMIFNRWGNLLHEGGAQNFSWNGMTADNKPVPPGTYYYIIGVGEVEIKGMVTVLVD